MITNCKYIREITIGSKYLTEDGNEFVYIQKLPGLFTALFVDPYTSGPSGKPFVKAEYSFDESFEYLIINVLETYHSLKEALSCNDQFNNGIYISVEYHCSECGHYESDHYTFRTAEELADIINLENIPDTKDCPECDKYKLYLSAITVEDDTSGNDIKLDF